MVLGYSVLQSFLYCPELHFRPSGLLHKSLLNSAEILPAVAVTLGSLLHPSTIAFSSL